MLNYPRAPSEPRGQLEKQEKDQRKIKGCKSATKSRRRRNNGAITISKGRDPHIRTALPLQTKKVSWRSFALFHRIWTITGNVPCLVAPKEFAFIRAGRRLMPFTAAHIAENRLAFVLNFTPYSIYGNEAGDFLLAYHNPWSRENIWHAAPGVYFPKLLHFGNNVFIFSLEREIINNNIYIRGGGK